MPHPLVPHISDASPSSLVPRSRLTNADWAASRLVRAIAVLIVVWTSCARYVLAQPIAWNQRVVAGPSPRLSHRMAYDPARGVTVLFGGLVNGGLPLNNDGDDVTLLDPQGEIAHHVTYGQAGSDQRFAFP